MSAYDLFKLMHVMVAVVGLGLITSMPILAASSKSLPREPLLTLSRWGTSSLAAMFLTGALMDLLAGGAYHATGWFRASGLTIIATGAILAYTRRAIAKSDPTNADRARKTVVRASSLASALIAAVTALMETKPF
jgi:hypothetical protein